MFLGARPTYCPFPDCSEMMVADDDGGEGDAGKLVTQSECQVCRRLFCDQSGVPWHAGADCAPYKKLLRGDTSREDVMLLEVATEKKRRRCSKCEFIVEKVYDCFHIVCSWYGLETQLLEKAASSSSLFVVSLIRLPRITPAGEEQITASLGAVSCRRSGRSTPIAGDAAPCGRRYCCLGLVAPGGPSWCLG